MGKATGIKVISQVGHDPEANRYKRVKEEEERLRADLRKDSKIKRVKERGAHRSLSGGYLEGGDSDEEGVSLAALKNKYKKNRGNKKQNYSSGEEDDSDVERKKSRKLEKAKNVLKDSDDSDGSARSRSPRRSRSRSRSASRSRSRSGSGSPARSRSGSEAGSRRSRSGSGSASD